MQQYNEIYLTSKHNGPMCVQSRHHTLLKLLATVNMLQPVIVIAAVIMMNF
jgi:hypothetical protein